MEKASLSVLAIGLTLVISAAGCPLGPGWAASKVGLKHPHTTQKQGSASLTDRQYATAHLQDHPPEDRDGSMVLAAVGYEEGADSGSIRQVSWTLADSPMVRSISSTFKNGANKLSQALTPRSPVKPADDPTSLATKAKPTPELYLSVARLSEESRNYSAAEHYYQEALKLWPHHLGALLAYARMKDRQGRLDEAIQLYQQAAKAHPEQSSVFNDLGLCLARRNKLPESIAALNRAIQLQPDQPLYRNNIATVLVEMGDVEAAFSHLAAVNRRAIAYYNVGYLLQKKGQSQAAASLFTKALEEDPSLTEATVWLGKLSGPAAPEVQSEPQAVADARVNSPSEEVPKPQLTDPGSVERQATVPDRCPAAALVAPQIRSRGTGPPDVRHLPPLPRQRRGMRPGVNGRGAVSQVPEDAPLPPGTQGTGNQTGGLETPPLPKAPAPAAVAPLPDMRTVGRAIGGPSDSSAVWPAGTSKCPTDGRLPPKAGSAGWRPDDELVPVLQPLPPVEHSLDGS